MKLVKEFDCNKTLKMNNNYTIINSSILNNFIPKNENVEWFSYFSFKKCIMIDNIQNLDCFTSKDIQDENKEITSLFQ